MSDVLSASLTLLALVELSQILHLHDEMFFVLVLEMADFFMFHHLYDVCYTEWYKKVKTGHFLAFNFVKS